MENVGIGNLFLGFTDGSAEARNDKFQELFYDPNNKYDELMSGNEKFIVIGSKGTGKTYLANYVVSKAKKNEHFSIINASEFQLCKLIAMNQNEVDEEMLTALCKWFWLDSLAHVIIDCHNKFWEKCRISKVGKLRRFIQMYENDGEFKIVREVISSSKEKEKNQSLKTENKKDKKNSGVFSRKVIRGNTVTKEAERKQFFELIPIFEKMVNEAIKEGEKYSVILDDLDEIQVRDQENGNIIISLIKAAKEYNLNISDNKYKFILLVRNDILDELQFNNANLSKIKTSCSVELYWLYDSMVEGWNHPLMKMILHKVRASCDAYKEYSNKKLYNELFPEKIDNKEPLDFLLDNGFGRPRDFVNFLTHAQKQFPDQQFFSAVCLRETRKPFSADFYDELVNQSAYYGKPEYVKQCLHLISAVKKPSFTYNEVETLYNQNKIRYDKIENLDMALSFLYKLGAIGNVWKARKDIHTSWAYKKEAMNDVDLDKKFTIHYGLRKKFSL